MGARLFDNPWMILILVIVIVLVFASAKLPDMARNLGRSARVLKSEVGEMKNEKKDDTVTGDATEVRRERAAGEDAEGNWSPDAHARDYEAQRPDSRLADPTRSREQGISDEPSDGTRLN
ncbi:sec-independent protein translocase protein TatA [Kytococcus aerolatus]|uniref:Sec-independent protein translocase protein TatA n=1 Tax=Kytococcus aerolatus TaxID=592308 RepID=A0A212T2A7_9MICO|nr:Sec-independent protein translocase subunit TatA [Kytococcus aerolatus]SNC59961.1 sec-independent protein translocase protein TatA [Kytococcus aerolatus]